MFDTFPDVALAGACGESSIATGSSGLADGKLAGHRNI